MKPTDIFAIVFLLVYISINLQNLNIFISNVTLNLNLMPHPTYVL